MIWLVLGERTSQFNSNCFVKMRGHCSPALKSDILFFPTQSLSLISSFAPKAADRCQRDLSLECKHTLFWEACLNNAVVFLERTVLCKLQVQPKVTEYILFGDHTYMNDWNKQPVHWCISLPSAQRCVCVCTHVYNSTLMCAEAPQCDLDLRNIVRNMPLSVGRHGSGTAGWQFGNRKG